jgi:hypothetical protein
MNKEAKDMKAYTKHLESLVVCKECGKGYDHMRKVGYIGDVDSEPIKKTFRGLPYTERKYICSDCF